MATTVDERIIRTWILVADSAEARLFLSYPGQRGWFEMHRFTHPQSRMKGRDLLESPPAMEKGTLPKELAADDFAKQLTEYLDVNLSRANYERLVLVAPPEFLGLLRSNLTKQVERRVIETLNEDLTHMEPRDIARHVEMHH